MLYRPSPSLTTVRTFSISAGLAASTVTPGSTAPEASFTVPEMDACANAVIGNSATQINPASIRNARNIYRCLLLDNLVVPWNAKGSRLVTEHDFLTVLEREGKHQDALCAARTRGLWGVSVDRQLGTYRQLSLIHILTLPTS